MNFEPPPKPMLHPNDNFRSCQMKMDAWYEDVRRMFAGAKRVYQEAQADAWLELSEPNSYTYKQAWILCIEPAVVELTDEQMLQKIDDPILRAALEKRLNK